jgi:hypothetical protein
MENLFDDLTQLEPVIVTKWNKPYDESDNPRTKARKLQQQFRRCKSLKNRLGMLMNMYFIGELLDSLEDIDYKRAKLVLSPYQYEVSDKTFILFSEIGITQLLRTKALTTTKMKRLTKIEIQNLISRTKLFLSTTFEIQVEEGLSAEQLIDNNEVTWMTQYDDLIIQNSENTENSVNTEDLHNTVDLSITDNSTN